MTEATVGAQGCKSCASCSNPKCENSGLVTLPRPTVGRCGHTVIPKNPMVMNGKKKWVEREVRRMGTPDAPRPLPDMMDQMVYDCPVCGAFDYTVGDFTCFGQCHKCEDTTWQVLHSSGSQENQI